MKTATLLISAIASTALIGCATAADSTDAPSSVFAERRATIEANKDLVSDFLDAFFVNMDVERTAPYFAEDYIQHNPIVPSGKAAIVEFIPALKASGIKITTQRMIADETLVVTHNYVENAQIIGQENVVTFDVFRVENGLIAEHWDNVSAAFPSNPSGRTQIDGPIEITDIDKTDENKALVLDFVETVLVGGQIDKIENYISSETYIQHNAKMGDGLAALKQGLAQMAANGEAVTYEKLHYSVGEGNFVLTASEGRVGEEHTAFYDLFRVANGLIVEHWDVLEEIPSKDVWAHQNGKF